MTSVNSWFLISKIGKNDLYLILNPFCWFKVDFNEIIGE